MMGLAALPLAENAAIRNSGPLMITALSVVVLGEKVGPRRWLALLVGFVGVLLIVRPGAATFNLGSIFVLISALFYALTVMVTRKLQSTDSSATMAYYSTLIYLIAAVVLAPLVLLVGATPDAHPSMTFLLRPWAMPTPVDFVIMAGLGVVWAAWMFFLARAYSLAQASVAAPFEYLALPIDIMWGFLIWGEVPTWLTWVGASVDDLQRDVRFVSSTQVKEKIMDYVRLGTTGMQVSRICLGCMGFGDAEHWVHKWVLNEENSRPVIQKALELGINFFDTANVYSLGVSEEILGRALKDFRQTRRGCHRHQSVRQDARRAKRRRAVAQGTS
jgi:uncharacterized membrane protein